MISDEAAVKSNNLLKQHKISSLTVRNLRPKDVDVLKNNQESTGLYIIMIISKILAIIDQVTH